MNEELNTATTTPVATEAAAVAVPRVGEMIANAELRE